MRATARMASAEEIASDAAEPGGHAGTRAVRAQQAPKANAEETMRFVMFIHNDPAKFAWWEGLTREEREADIERHRAWFREHAQAGHIVGGEELATPDRARIARRRKGEAVITDGPFVETTELLGGFVLLEADDLDAATAIGASWPGLEFEHDAIEVRPTDATTAE